MKINLIEYFVETVRQFPNNTAIVDGNRQISFIELDNKSRQLAKKIADVCHCKNRPIAMFMPKTVEALQTDLAITYSGNTYMNLDVKNPVERLHNILALIQPAAVVTNNKFKAIIEPIVGDAVKVINLDEMDENADLPSAEWFLDRNSDLIDTDPYCIINTSGSTGTPKGVVLNHKSFIDFMAQTFDEFKFTENDVIGSCGVRYMEL